VEPPLARLAATEVVEQTTNLSVEGGGVPVPENKLPFEGLRGMAGARHNRSRCRGAEVCGSAPTVVGRRWGGQTWRRRQSTKP
jgi:hypothetical protein